MRVAIVVFPGSNRERDLARAFAHASGTAPALVWHGESELPAGVDLVALPGGFAHGDYLRCGAIAAHAPIMPAVRAHAARGGLVLGICNGFQILCEAGLLPGVLVRNRSLRFQCRDVHLKVERADTAFTRGYAAGQILRVPIAHGEGAYAADAATLAALEDRGQVVFRYVTADGAPDDVNGAANGIAGLVSPDGNVLGLMPHPENAIESLTGSVDGLALFEALSTARAA